jgi:nitroreductase
MDVIEALNTCTAMRYLKEDPVPRSDLEQLVHAATRASSPGNSQGWEFVVIDDTAIKTQIGTAVMQAMAPVFANKPSNMDAVSERMYLGAEHLARNFARVPAWILGAARKVYPPHAPEDMFMYSTIYPAGQNLIVAARAMDIGACFTTFHRTAEPLIRQLCAVPDDVHLCLMIAVGYPERAFQPVKRKPVEDVLHWNQFS